MRKDLAEICQIIQNACPKIKRIWISTNGFRPNRVKERVLEVVNAINFERVKNLEINVSIDGLEKTHDMIRGVEGGFKQALETIQLLKPIERKFPLKISIGTVIQPLNLREIEDIEGLAGDLQVPIFFQPVMFDEFFNIKDKHKLAFSPQDSVLLRDLVEKKLSNGYSTTSFYWRDYLSMLDGKRNIGVRTLYLMVISPQ